MTVTHHFVSAIPDDPEAAAAGEVVPSNWNAAHDVSLAHTDLTGVAATQHHDNANDPSSGQKAALAGTSGTPGSGNKYVTDADSRLTDSRAPTGSAGGDLSGSYPNPDVVNDSHSHTGATVTTTDAPSGAVVSIDADPSVGAGTAIARATHGHRANTYSSNAAAVGTASAGTSTTAPSRGDHVHPTGAGTPTTSAVGDAAATGTGPAAAMTNHVHGRESFGATAAAVGTTSGGAAATPSRSDHVHATGAGTPSTQAFGDAASTGTGPAAAMTDHKHAMPNSTTGPDANITIDASGAAGSANTAARSGHGHQVATDSTAQVAVTPDGTATAGTSGTIARSQHQHGMATYSSTPANVGTASAGTSATAPSRGDHVHALSTLPTFTAVGASATGTGDITPGLPTGHTTNDILLIFVQSDNQTITAPAGYTQLGPQIGIGTAAAASATRGAIFWKRDGGSETDPTITDTGDHTLAQIMGIRGCVTTGDPFISVGQTRKTTASTTGTGSAGATHIDNCLVVQAFWHALDSASAVFSNWTNADLGSFTERIDVGTTDGNGGGIGVATGTKALAGSFAASTVTETSTVDTGSTFYMIPAGMSTAGAIDRQVFTTAGFADTWRKPSGAKWIQGTAIGGGASGSAGRNAATAAGGGGGGAGGRDAQQFAAYPIGASLTVTAGAGGAITANSDGAASNAGANSSISDGTRNQVLAYGGFAASASGTGAGGDGGAGGGPVAAAAGASVNVYASLSAPGGTGGTTAFAGSTNRDSGGGGGSGGGTSQAAGNGGSGRFAAGGGGGGRSNTNFSNGGSGNFNGTTGNVGASTVGASAADSPLPEYGAGGGASGNSATGDGGAGGWPGGGGGGGGTQSGHVTGGKGGDGVVVIVTLC